jgi:GT2 family glycosyltransferase
MRPPRILFVYQFLTLGGVEVVMQTRLRELARRDIQARMLFLGESGGGESIFAKMGHQIAVHTDEAEVEKYLRDFDPDWISTIDTPDIIPIARRVVPNARIAYEVHTPYPDYYDLVLDRDLLNGVSGILVPSQSQKDFISLRLARPLPIEVVPNSISSEFFQTLESSPPKRSIVMWVGRLDDLKNWRGFIELGSRIRESIDAEFWIIGGLRNHEEVNLFRAIHKADLVDSFRWLPAVNYENMPRLYNFVGSAGGCVVSTSWGESFGMAALEAMASRCPVVASDVIGLRDIIRHRETGWLYPSMNLDRARDFVLEAIQDLNVRQAIIENAQREARKFTPAATADRLLEVFSSWMKEPLPDARNALYQGKRASEKRRRTAALQAAQFANQTALIDSLSQELNRDDAAQRLLFGKQILHLLSAQLSETQKIIDSRDDAIRWLSSQIANMERIIQTRDEAVAWLGSNLTEREQKALTLEKTVRDRDEAIEWLKSKVAELEHEALTLVSLQAELRQALSRCEDLTALNESQNALSMQWESVAERLSGELASQQDRAASLEAVVAEKEKVLQAYLSRLKTQAEKLTQRDEGIEWLKGELDVSEKKNQRLIGSNSFLKMQLAKNELATRDAEQHLGETQLELEKIKRSFGWRLLSRYGRIKYRYLLPLYRKLNLLPAEVKVSVGQAAAAPVIPHATAEDTAHEFTVFADEGSTQTSPEGITPTVDRGEVDREETERIDFYEALTLLPRPPREQLEAILEKRPPAEALRRHDVICFSIIDWEFRYQRPQQIMSQFAAHGHRVFYISTSRFIPAEASQRVAVKQIKDNVYEVQLAVARMPDVYGDVIEGDNKRTFIESLDELRRTYRINEAIAYTMISSWGAVALETGRLWGWRTIYDCMDEWENFPGVKRELLNMEQELVTKCDLLVVTAQRLWEKWESFERPMVLARNGVDLDFYDRNYHPNNMLSGIGHHVVGYFGAIADWFDIELVTYVARARPDYTFVLLGGVFNVDVSELEALPNVRLLGQQPYETMPQYLYHFDVCMIPFKINPITEATDPVKLYEYLSAGKPVVSVALSEVEPYGEYLYLARDRDDFLKQLDAAIAEDDRDMILRRRKFAEQHSWPQRYKTIEAGISRVTRRASIVIVTYNNLALNKLCLESVIRNTEYPNYEIIVVDNNSTDGTPSYLRYLAAQRPNISIILNEANNGFARANNQGIAISNGDYIVLLNNDTIVPPGWLSRLLRHLADEAVGMVGPVTNFVGNEAKLDVDYQTWAEMEDFSARHTWEHDGLSADIYMLAMFCVAFRRNIYDEIGPLDEQFGVGMFEDDDYAQRMKAKGYRVLCVADAFVHHFGQAAFKKLIENGSYDRLFEENRSYYETKWNVTWTPHKNARLKFERLAHALDRQAAENKTLT